MQTFFQMLLDGLVSGSVYALLALGFSLIYRMTGVVNLAQGAFAIFGAFVMYSLLGYGLPTALAAVGAVAACAAISLVLALIFFVPALPKLPESSMLMITAGMLTLLAGLQLIVWGNAPYTLPQFSGEVPVRIFNLTIPTQGFWIVAISIVVVLIMRAFLVGSKYGNALLACADDPLAARLVGIPTSRMALLSFVIGAVIAAAGGVALVPLTSFEFDTGSALTISGFVAVAIGGLGSFGGSIIGGLFLGIAEQAAATYVSSTYAQAITLGLLLAMLVLRPGGLAPAGARLRTDTKSAVQIFSTSARFAPRTVLIVAAVALVAAVSFPFLVSADSPLLRSVIITGTLYIALIGLDLMMGFTGQVNLGQGAFVAIGGYSAGIASVRLGLPPIMGVLIGIAIAMASASALALVSVHLKGHYLALATLAFGLVVDSLLVGADDFTGGPSGLVGIPSLSIGAWTFDTLRSNYFLVLAIIVVVLLGVRGVMRSNLGRTLQAIRTDQTAAAALGINVRMTRLGVFACCAGLGALAGSLYAFEFHFLSPDMVGTPKSLELVSMLVLGGEATLIGPFFGALLLVVLPDLFQSLAQYKTFLEGLLLMSVFRFLPAGLWGEATRLLVRRPPPAASGDIAKAHVPASPVAWE